MIFQAVNKISCQMTMCTSKFRHLTIFFQIFTVLCNNPKKYAVVEPEGRIAAQKCIDIVVRHVAVSPSAVQQTDKFRIQIFDEASPEEIVGKRDVLATLHPGAFPKGNYDLQPPELLVRDRS